MTVYEYVYAVYGISKNDFTKNDKAILEHTHTYVIQTQQIFIQNSRNR